MDTTHTLTRLEAMLNATLSNEQCKDMHRIAWLCERYFKPYMRGRFNDHATIVKLLLIPIKPAAFQLALNCNCRECRKFTRKYVHSREKTRIKSCYLSLQTCLCAFQSAIWHALVQ